MIRSVLRLELRRSRMLVLWLTIASLAYSGFIAAFYPTIKENQALLDQYLKVYPKAFLAAFGMEGSLTDPGIFFSTYIGSMLWPIIAAIGAIILATRSSAADADRGWLELPLATPVPRTSYLLSAIAVQFAVMGALALACVGGVVVGGWLVGVNFDAPRFLAAGVLGWAFGCSIAAVTTLLAVITLNRGTAGGIAAGVLLAMYLVNVIAKMQPDLDRLRVISAFAHFYATPIIDEGRFPFGDLAIFVTVSAAAWGAAVWLFRRRDFSV